MKIAIEAEISRPPQLVFPYLADPEKAMQWQKNVVSGEIIEARPEMIGTRFQEVIEEDGNRLEMSGVITAYIPNCVIPRVQSPQPSDRERRSVEAGRGIEGRRAFSSDE